MSFPPLPYRPIAHGVGARHSRPVAALLCVALTFVSPAFAQQPSGIDTSEAAIARDLVAIFERPAGTPIDPKVALPRFDAFFAKYDGHDLGKFGYAAALKDYLARDYAGAAAKADDYLRQHATVPIPEHGSMLGRVYLNVVGGAMRGDDVDPARVQHAAIAATKLYDDPAIVVRIAANLANSGKLANADDLRVAVAKALLARDLSAAAHASALRTLFADAAPRAAATPAAASGRNAAVTPLKPFTATTTTGREISLDSYRGKVLLVDFWATWCPPCMAEMPNVVATYERFKDRGFEVLGVSLDKAGDESKIADAAQRLRMTWDQVYDGKHWEARLAVENGIRSIPMTYLIDREGRTRFTRLRGEELARRVEELLAAPAPAQPSTGR